MPHMLPISKTRPDIFSCGSMLQCITEEVKKQAERQIKSRFIMYVPGVHNLPLKITSKGSTFWTHCRIAKTQESERWLGFRQEAELRNDRGAPPRGREVSKVHARKMIQAIRRGRIWQNSKCNWKVRRFFCRVGLLQRPMQGGTTLPRRRQRSDPVKTEAQSWIQTILAQWKRENVARQCPVPDAEQWSSLVSWTWSPSTQSSWWDSSSSQTWRQSPKPTSSDVPALVLNTRKESSSARLVVATQLRRRFFYLRIDNRRVTTRTGSVRKYTVARPFAAL